MNTPTFTEILEWLSYEKEKNQRELKETQRMWGHSCYWAWVEWWVIETCQRLEDFINGIEE